MTQLENNLELARSLCKKVPKFFKMGSSNHERFRGTKSAYKQCVEDLNEDMKSIEFCGLADDPMTCVKDMTREGDVQFARCQTLRTESQQCISNSRRKLDGSISGGFRWRDEEEVQTMVKMAQQATCGNCGEMAGKTFLLLRESPQSAAVMAIDVVIKGVGVDDHQFVVIGGTGDVRFPKDAVVCDPWAYKLKNDDMSFGAYPASKLSTKLGLLVESWEWARRPVMIHRKARTATSAPVKR